MRIKPSDHEHSILYAETGGACPLCKSAIMSKKAGSKKPISLYEIAHIYPLNPNSLQSTALKSYPTPEDINSLENYILLSPKCHTNYDKDFKIVVTCPSFPHNADKRFVVCELPNLLHTRSEAHSGNSVSKSSKCF